MMTITDTIITMVGYTDAFLSMASSLAFFSNLSAIRSKATSSLPEASPAATMDIMMEGNILGYFAIDSERVSPFWILALTFTMVFAMVLFSVATDNISRASMMVTPAFIILMNCLQNTLRSLILIPLPKLNSMSLVRIFASSMWISVISFFFICAAASPLFSACIVPFFSFPLLSIARYVKSATSYPPKIFRFSASSSQS